LISKEWTWVSGSNTTVYFGIYGTKGVASASNTPGARSTSVSWKDKQGNFWLYGGNGYGENSLGALSDFWKLDLVSFEWTWVTGSKNTQQFANHGIKGVNAITNDPGGKGSASSWIDVSGQLWLFGGGFNGLANDLWRYNDGCLGPNCFASKSNSSSNLVSSRFQSNSLNNRLQVTVNSLFKTEEIAKPVLSNIQSLEIYNTTGQLLKKVNSNLESYDILRNSRRVAGLMPGLYFVKVFYKDKTFKTIKQFLQ
jgi:hypothetical protein